MKTPDPLPILLLKCCSFVIGTPFVLLYFAMVDAVYGVIKRILTRWGVTTMGTIHHAEPDACEDFGVNGQYTYIDSRGRIHHGMFKACYHFPQGAFYAHLHETYKLGAVHPVVYWPLWPFVHRMNFPIYKEDGSKDEAT